MAEAVSYELQDGVAWLVIQRPEARAVEVENHKRRPLVADGFH